jgi:putative spermidine/putrescine transport system permease protein
MAHQEVSEPAVAGDRSPRREAAGTGRRRLRRSRTSSETRWLLAAPLAFLTLLLLLPILSLVSTALDIPGTFGKALTDSVFLGSIERTLIMAILVTAFTVVLGTLYVLAIAAAPRWLAGLLLAVLFLTLWTSLLVRTFGWVLLELPTGGIYQVLHLIGLRNTPLGLYQTTPAAYPAMVHVMMPYVVLPVYAAISRLDPAQLRAARVFGARPVLVVRQVVLPQLRPAMVSGGVLVFIMSLGIYVTPLLLGSPTDLTVAGDIDLNFNHANQPELATAMSVLLLGGILLIYLVADRLFRVSEKWES